jgi:uncharacterized protein YuzE
MSKSKEKTTPTFTWDEEVDSGYIRLREGEPDHQEEAFVEGAVSSTRIIVDLDEDGQVLGIEILK